MSFTTSVTSTTPSPATTPSFPIVSILGTDGVQAGLVASVSRPGGNLTGVSSFLVDAPKRLGLVRELLPDASTIALLVNPNEPFAETQVNTVHAAARAIGQKMTASAASEAYDPKRSFGTRINSS
jgi:putative tryptophan/tyrosine transport system substrate-binding protein